MKTEQSKNKQHGITNKVIREKIENNVRDFEYLPERIKWFNNETIKIGKQAFHVVLNHRDGLDLEKFNERFDWFLFKYDFMVGDWAGDQLRIRGFYKDDIKGVNRDQRFAHIEEYLMEYCNYDCRFFVIEKIDDEQAGLPGFSSKSSAMVKPSRKTIKPANNAKKAKRQHAFIIQRGKNNV